MKVSKNPQKYKNVDYTGWISRLLRGEYPSEHALTAWEIHFLEQVKCHLVFTDKQRTTILDMVEKYL